MSRISILLLAAALSSSWHCDAAGLKSTKIINGQATDIQDFPFMVSLQYNGTFFGHDYDHFCCGSIINEQWIITSAQCAQARATNEFHVRVGSSKYYENGAVYHVERVVLHPEFNELSRDYDVGLLKVKQAIAFDANVQPIKLPKREDAIREGSSFSIAGWGAVQMLGKISDELLESSVRKITDDSCQAAYGSNAITQRMFCVFTKGSGPCVGDSGSPALLDGTLVGLASWSYNCAFDNPTVYAKVSSVADWIASVLQQP